MYLDLQLACLLSSRQAAACLLYAADDSQKRHLICESEGVIRKCFRLEASHCRSRYATNIRFALSDFFFDNERQSEGELIPPASKRFVLAEELASASTAMSSPSSNDGECVISSTGDNCKITKCFVQSNTESLSEKDNKLDEVVATNANEVDVKCLENWLFDDENHMNEVVTFDCSFSSTEDQNRSPNAFDTKVLNDSNHERHPTPPISSSLCEDNPYGRYFEEMFQHELNPLHDVGIDDILDPIISAVDGAERDEKYLYNDDNNNENSNGSSCHSTDYGSEAPRTFPISYADDSGFSSTVSTPELVPSTQQTTTTTTTVASSNCSIIETAASVTTTNVVGFGSDNFCANDNKNVFDHQCPPIFRHQGFGQLFEF